MWQVICGFQKSRYFLLREHPKTALSIPHLTTFYLIIFYINQTLTRMVENRVVKLGISFGICLLAGYFNSLYAISVIPTWFASLKKPGFFPARFSFCACRIGCVPASWFNTVLYMEVRYHRAQ